MESVSVVPQILYSLFTLYMMMILVRWFGPFISLDTEEGRLRWIPRLTDPLINWFRKVLPHMGPVDFGPIAALVLVWITREIVS